MEDGESWRRRRRRRRKRRRKRKEKEKMRRQEEEEDRDTRIEAGGRRLEAGRRLSRSLGFFFGLWRRQFGKKISLFWMILPDFPPEFSLNEYV